MIAARMYFSTVKKAAAERARILERLERARAGAEVRTQQYEQAGGTGDGDPPAFNLVSLEFDAAADLLQLEAFMDEANAILFGEDGRGGLAKSLGHAYADAVCREYLLLESPGEAAQAMGVSVSTVQWLQHRAFASMDAAYVISDWH